jgi:5'-nucleotidase
MRTPRTTIAVAAIAALLPIAAPVTAQSPSAAPSDASVVLTLLHNNDGESSLLPLTYRVGEEEVPLAIGGVAAYKAVLDREVAAAREAGNSVLNINAGDVFLASATLACSLPPAPADTPIYDAVAQAQMGYDVHILGNHEFDYGPAFLARFIRSFGEDQPTQPFLAANIDVSKEPALSDLAVRNGLILRQPRNGKVLARSMVVVDATTGERFGVIGAVTPELPTISSPGKVSVTPDLAATATAVQAEVDRLLQQKVDRIILASQLQDVDNDRELVKLVKGLDIAIAGGGDELLASDAVPDEQELLPGETQEIAGTYPMTEVDPDGRTVYIVTTAGNYKYAGRLDVAFGPDGEITGVVADTSFPRRVIPAEQDGTQVADLAITDAVASDPGIGTSVIEPVQACLADFAATPIVRSDVIVNVARGGTEPFSLGVRSGETNGGNLVADSFLAAYDAYAAASDLPARGPEALVIAVQNGGGIRQNAGNLLPAGGTPGEVISRLDTLNVLPFDNYMVVVEDIDAAELKTILERSCEAVGGGGFLQVAALAYSCDMTQEVGSRVRSVTYTAGTADAADDVAIVDDAGTALEAGPFRVVTNQFTANGGDDYPTFAEATKTKLVTKKGTQIFYEQALREYLASFPEAGDPALPTIAADDPRYAQESGEGRITIVTE